jgi:sortase A
VIANISSEWLVVASQGNSSIEEFMFTAGRPLEPQFRTTRKVADRHDRIRAARIWLEILLLTLGVALLLAFGMAEFSSYSSSRASVRKFAVSESSTSASEGRGEAFDAGRTVSLVTADIPLAVLRIPRIDLVAPVFDGTEEATLHSGLGRIRGTALPGQAGNIGIAGHRDSFFRGLKNIRNGDVIELETLRGKSTYIVDQIAIVDPHAVEVLRPRFVSSITLVTCYPFRFIGSAPRRFIVKASLTQTKRQDGRRNLIAPQPRHVVQQGDNHASQK